MRRTRLLVACLVGLALSACQRQAAEAPTAPAGTKAAATQSYAAQHAGDYATVPLKADLSAFDDEGKRMIANLVQAAQVTDDLYWQQSWSGVIL